MNIFSLFFVICFFLNVVAIACDENDSTCSSTSVDIDVAIIDNVSFYQMQSLNFGNVTRGEYVTVSSDQENQQRGKIRGIVGIESDYNSNGVQVSCIAASSYINFTENDPTFFSECQIQQSGSSSSPSSSILLNQDTTGIQFYEVRVGGSIHIPSNILQDGNFSGVVRIEVQLL